MNTRAAGTTLDVDLNGDPRGAAQEYEALVAGFDAQREGAAHAVFGLGEAYRKLGRLEEARAQYGRILREFVDFPELVKESQKLLLSNQPGKSTNNLGPAAKNRSQESLAEEQELLMQELKLLENELETIKQRTSIGLEPTSSVMPIQREILQLKQRLVRLRNERGESDSSSSRPQ